jgi:DNA-nicking Smr family endonuclease
MPKHRISQEDRDLFQEAMAGVTPLKGLPKKITTTAKSTTISPLPKTRPKAPAMNPLVLDDAFSSNLQAESTLNWHCPDIGHRRLVDLKQGRVAYEARLDLHGLTRERAKSEFAAFIHQARTQHRRCVLIIHGKGGAQGEAPILKNLVNQWLQDCGQVLAFHSAIPAHGGRGAVYVLLKK